ncbi:MAG TPA: site-specific integrase, partial [Sphingomonas sp.]|nr:site-specific integrase [Sphingomonas sp.]
RIDFVAFNHHGFRHLFAVEYLRNGRGSIYDLQGELGHSSISVTERYLAFLTPEQARAAKSTVAQRGAHEQRSGAAAK